MQPAPQHVESTFSRSWELLKNNWSIVIPGLVVGLIVGVVDYLISPYSSNTYGVASSGTAILLSLVNLVGFIATQCYVTGMAGAAWERGSTDLSDGTRAFERDAGRVFVALIGLVVALVIAAILAFPTLGISVLLYFYFFIYTFPSAIIGERPGIAALGESFRIASRRVAPTLIITIMYVVIIFVGYWIAAVLNFIPFIGPIVSAIIIQLVFAYVTLVVVGEYLALRDSLGTPPATG